jgi:glycerol-3-phosphate dehydrogenase
VAQTEDEMKLETQVVVIGGGLTGAGILRDLALRGVDAVLLERRDFNAGASGANHGLLHSGGRYVVTDPDSAAECVRENAVLKRIAAGCVEDTGGLFLALDEDDESYAADFLAAAERIGLAAEPISAGEALESEPLLNPAIRAAIRVPDAAINPFMATDRNLQAARALGARVLLHTQVIGMQREGRRIVRVDGIHNPSGDTVEVHADQVVSAAGPWVDQVGALAGADLDIAYSKGSLLITNTRLVDRVLNRLRPPADGDIVVPGETVTITGTTSIRIQNLDHLTTPAAEVDRLVAEAAKLVPRMADVRYVRAYAGVRPLVQSTAAAGDRGLSRTFTIFDHQRDGLENFASIAGGKLTTYRLMAEKLTDLVCARLGVGAPCRTAALALPGSEAGRHLDAADRLVRLRAPPPGGAVLCECEMVGRDEVTAIIDALDQAGHQVDPNAIRLRSRLGMGACQGGFCSMRAIGLLYERGRVKGGQGNDMLTDFLERRWSGIKPMLWGDQLRQEQFLEAIYCGSLNIDGNL